MIDVTYNKELSILEIKYCNDIYLDDILKYINAVRLNTNYPRKLKVLTDAENAIFKFTFQDLEIINKLKNDTIINYDIIIDAFVINGPETAAISVLYQNMSEIKNYYFKVFSSQEAAIKWLDSF